jgi:hypothetical protein
VGTGSAYTPGDAGETYTPANEAADDKNMAAPVWSVTAERDITAVVIIIIIACPWNQLVFNTVEIKN